VQPHVQVKLIEFEAALAGLGASPSQKITVARLKALKSVSRELEQLIPHIENLVTLRAILDTFQRGDAFMDEVLRRMKNGPR
jgi:hypothetical protein